MTRRPSNPALLTALHRAAERLWPSLSWKTRALGDMACEVVSCFDEAPIGVSFYVAEPCTIGVYVDTAGGDTLISWSTPDTHRLVRPEEDPEAIAQEVVLQAREATADFFARAMSFCAGPQVGGVEQLQERQSAA